MVVIMKKKYGERQQVVKTVEEVKEAIKWIRENKTTEYSYYYIVVDYHKVIEIYKRIEENDPMDDDPYYQYSIYTGVKVVFTGTKKECEEFMSKYSHGDCHII